MRALFKKQWQRRISKLKERKVMKNRRKEDRRRGEIL
jgi:hypothetical protein